MISPGRSHRWAPLVAVTLPLLILLYCYALLCLSDHDGHADAQPRAPGSVMVVDSAPDDQDDDCGLLIYQPMALSLHHAGATVGHSRVTDHPPPGWDLAQPDDVSPLLEGSHPPRRPPPGAGPSGRSRLLLNCVLRT
jgi:hypothetical protein